MDEISATDVKQRFGEALRACEAAPVAITRHGRVIAVLSRSTPQLDSKRLARQHAAAADLARLSRHQALAMRILAEPDAAGPLIEAASAFVDKWAANRTCSPDYIVGWRKLLALPPKELAVRMCSDLGGWGNALRQNSPFLDAPRQ